ncbi:hypothetical protein BD414DRAFT_526063 [Trametes punicea]|nr:hypothetical protein BD414DRAFT_526063 [Trametes punicea]
MIVYAASIKSKIFILSKSGPCCCTQLRTLIARGLAGGSGGSGNGDDMHSEKIPSPSLRQSDGPPSERSAQPASKGTRNGKTTIAERDAELMNSWKEREGSLVNAEFEDGHVAEGYRRNVGVNRAPCAVDREDHLVEQSTIEREILYFPDPDPRYRCCRHSILDRERAVPVHPFETRTNNVRASHN